MIKPAVCDTQLIEPITDQESHVKESVKIYHYYYWIELIQLKMKYESKILLYLELIRGCCYCRF